MKTGGSLSLSSLIGLCRTLRHGLSAGVSIRKLFRQQAEKGPSDLRIIAWRIQQQLDEGSSVHSAMKKESVFPSLFLTMVEVGEESGHLAEVCASLEDYYSLQLHIRRKLRTQMAMPILQFIIALFVIAFLIWILGVIAASRPGSRITGILGLSGLSGALLFLGIAFGIVIGGLLCYKFLFRNMKGGHFIDVALLRLPFIGPCIQSLALARFALALNLTLNSGMSIMKAVRLSLQATGNAAFTAESDRIEKELRSGEELSQAITGTGVFPEDFRHILEVAEESGRIPESMAQQYRRYQEDAAYKIKALAKVAVWGVWLFYGLFIVIMIFQIASIYFGALGA